MTDWAAASKRQAIRKYGAIGARAAEASAGTNGMHPFRRVGPTKVELREQASAALADYSGPIIKLQASRRKTLGR
jgi:hypothetical protein